MKYLLLLLTISNIFIYEMGRRQFEENLRNGDEIYRLQFHLDSSHELIDILRKQLRKCINK